MAVYLAYITTCNKCDRIRKKTGHPLIFHGEKQEYFCALQWFTCFAGIFDMTWKHMLGSYMNIFPSWVPVTSLAKSFDSSSFSGWPSWDVLGSYPVFKGEICLLLSKQNHMIPSQPWTYFFIQKNFYISKIKLVSIGRDSFKQFVLLRLPSNLAWTPPGMGNLC